MIVQPYLAWFGLGLADKIKGKQSAVTLRIVGQLQSRILITPCWLRFDKLDCTAVFQNINLIKKIYICFYW